MRKIDEARIVGLCVSDGSVVTSSRRLLTLLGERHRLLGRLEPELTSSFRLLGQLRHFHPDGARWRARAGFNKGNFDALSGAIERQLRRHENNFDLLFQVQTVFAPGELQARRPFVIYTDNIMSLTERFYPSWAPLTSAGFRRWRKLEAHVFHSAAHVLPWSDFVRDALICDYGVDPSRVTSVGAGANIVLPDLQSRRWDSAEAIFVGRHFSRKGGHELLSAWARVRERLPHARLTVVGPRYPPAGADLTGVDWRGPVARQEQLIELYRAASVFVMPSLFEPWGNVFLEAMGCGLPCIGTAHCAMPEIIADGESGLLVPPEAVEPLADALVRLLGDPALAETYGRRAHAEVLARHRWDLVADRVSPILSSAAEGPAPPSSIGRRGLLPQRAHPGAHARWRSASSG